MGRIHKIKSFEKFVSELQERRPGGIAVAASCEPPRGLFGPSASVSVGALGDWQYGLAYDTKGGKGDRAYREPLFTVFQSEYGFGDAPARNKRTISCLLAAQDRIGTLVTALPGIDVYLAKGDGRRMDEQELQRLQQDARHLGVVSALQRQ